MKSRYMVLRKGGQYLLVDLVKVRLGCLRRRIFAWCKVVEPVSKLPGVKMAMVRLSYDLKGTMIEATRPEVGDIRRFIQALRSRLGVRLLAYAWVAEVHRDGTLHYHVCIVYKGFLSMPDRAYWGRDSRGRRTRFERMWKKGCTHTDFDVRSAYYMASYSGKEYQKDYLKLPEGFHAWAVYVSDEAVKMDLRIESLNKIQRDLFDHCYNEGGQVIEEAFSEMGLLYAFRKKCEKEQGMSWEFVGTFNDWSDLDVRTNIYWPVCEEVMQGHMYYKFAPASKSGGSDAGIDTSSVYLPG